MRKVIDPNLETLSATKTSTRVLDLSIHASHLLWIVALIGSIDKGGVLSTYIYFLPLLVFATFLEICRWAFIGEKFLEISGAYELASAVDSVNRKFLTFSWYVVPPVPPFKVLERYAAATHNFPIRMTRGQIFAKFWLKSEITWPLLGCLILIPTLYFNSSPNFLGLAKYFPISCFFWIVEFGFFSKILALLFYATGIRISKGFDYE